MSDPVQVSIIFLAKNEAHNLPHSLGGIFAQQTARPFEVLFIDSGSRDNTLELARQYPVEIHEIPPEQFHHARTRNLGASLARGEYLVFLAADAFPAGPGWLEAMLRNFDEPTVAAVYGRHLPKPGSKLERHHALGSLYGPERVVKDQGNRQRLGYRYYHFSTVNAAIRKTVWEETKFPDDLRVFEDIAIAKAILDRGWTIVYEPQASVYHSHDYPSPVLFRRYFDIGAVYQRLGIWKAASSRQSIQSDGLRSVGAKMRALRRQPVRDISVSLWYDAVKFAGIVLGRHERMLPLALKRRLSAFHIFG